MYEAYDGHHTGLSVTDKDYSVDRTVTMATGVASQLCLTIATLCSFYAGMRHASRGKGKGGSCRAGFLITSWIVFALTFINVLIVLVLAFNKENIIYPKVVWSALIGSILAWMLMFGYAEMARRG